MVELQQKYTPSKAGATVNKDELHKTQNLFSFRKTMLDQFNRFQNELEDKFKRSQEKFATKEELFLVIKKVQEFRNELEKVFLDEALEKAEQQKEEDIFSDLNLFNLRKKYHKMSLKMRSEEVDPFGFDPIFDKFIEPLFLFLYQKYWRVETYGLENIPNEGASLLVANHSGGLPYDASMLKIALAKEHQNHRDVRFLVEDFLFHFPFLGSLMNRFGGVRASPDNAIELLNEGQTVLVFPEGVKGLGKLYKDKYHLARFGRGGFVRLCLKTRAPLVPVAFIGPEEIHPMIAKETFFSKALGVPYFPITWTYPWLGILGMIPLPSKWSIHVLPPIDFSNYGPGAEKDRVLVYKKSNEVKSLIQDTISSKLKERRSIWFG